MTLEGALEVAIGSLVTFILGLLKVMRDRETAHQKRVDDQAAAHQERLDDQAAACEKSKEDLAKAIDTRHELAVATLQASHEARVGDLQAALAREQKKNDAWDEDLREEAKASLAGGPQ